MVSNEDERLAWELHIKFFEGNEPAASPAELEDMKLAKKLQEEFNRQASGGSATNISGMPSSDSGRATRTRRTYSM